MELLLFRVAAWSTFLEDAFGIGGLTVGEGGDLQC